jgi:hypothetical protein
MKPARRYSDEWGQQKVYRIDGEGKEEASRPQIDKYSRHEGGAGLTLAVEELEF